MSAVVCGKRSDILEISLSSLLVSKRNPLFILFLSQPSLLSLKFRRFQMFILQYVFDYLVAVFPDIDKQSLEKALEVYDDDLDFAIKRLYELRLSTVASKAEVTHNVGTLFSTQGIVANNGKTTSREELSAGPDFPVDGADWVELLIRKMMSASNVQDGKVRVSRVLEALEKSICARATAEASQSLQLQSNMSVRNSFEERAQELHQLKQLVSQHQEQLRTLEVNNYTLSMHLKQAQQSNSIPGHFTQTYFS